MMETSISSDGIDKAIRGLNYKNVHSLKYKLIDAIRRRYTGEKIHDPTQGPVPEPVPNPFHSPVPYGELIAVLWDIDPGTDPGQGRLKNLNSIRSAVNGDLLRGFKTGSNPEGLIVGPDFTFVMSDEAKDSFIGSFSRAFNTEGSISIEQAVEISRRFGEFLTKIPDAGVLGFLDKIIEALDSDHPPPGQNIPELITLFGNLISRISKADFLKEKDRIEELVRLMSEKAEIDIEGIDGVVEDEEPEGLAETKELEEVDAEDLEEFEADEDTEIESAADDEEAGKQPENALEIVEVLDCADESEDSESVPEDAVDADELEEMEEDELNQEQTEEEDEEEVDADRMEDLQEATEVVEVLDADGEMEEVDLDEAAGGGVLPDLERFDSPLDLFPEDDLVQDGTISDPEKKRLLSDRFNDYLGVVERHFNQYLHVPKGKYRVGSHNSRPGEISLRPVSMPGFHFGKYPVTNALFEIFVDRTGYKTTAEKKGYGTVCQGRFQKINDDRTGKTRYQWHSGIRQDRRDGAFWYQPTGPGSTLHRKRNHPVVQVSIKDALAFASWVGKRLPTEDEWEAAARGPSGRVYPWGDDWIENRCNIAESEVSDTLPVDHFPGAETELGLADLLGNTLEWTIDRLSGGGRGEHYIAKGGSWISEPPLELSSRYSFPVDFSSNILGFRCLAE